MDQSLSVVLPVHNAQSTLAAQVQQLLDVLPDLTSRFEVLIVDDGSTDHTQEVATDLAVEFPQVRILRTAGRHGTPAAVQMGLQRTLGDIVFVQDERTRVCPSDLRRLWQLRHDQGGIQMIRRPAIVDSNNCAAPETEVKLDLAARIDKFARGQSTRKRPNFLSQLKAFATGE